MNNEDDMTKPFTKRDLLEVLDLWGNAFEARIEAKFEAKFEARFTKLEARFETFRRELTAEFAQHADRILDEARQYAAVIDEKYNDLPPRVNALEARAEAHKDLPDRVAVLEANAAPPPKRQRRR
jgi:hypothetical protein